MEGQVHGVGAGRVAGVRRQEGLLEPAVVGPPAPRAGPGTCGEVQWAQRRAASGIWLRHSLHSRVVGRAASPGRMRCPRVTRRLIGSTTKKNTAAAITRKVNSASMKSPYWKRLWLTVKY